MCGFAGEFLFAASGRADLDRSRRQASRLVHRGPDEEGSFLSPDGRCAIGFRRLAVIDPAGSHQPMVSIDGKLVVAFNGEIYNFRQLRQRLSADGAVFRTAGDTEVLLHLYQRHGSGMLEHLSGMFAFAIYDSAASRLFLARVRLGEKPLWYSTLGDRIIFASEAKALLACPLIDKSFSPQALASYLTTGYIPAPASAYRSLRKCPPASYLELTAGPAEPVRYWSPRVSTPPPGEEEAAQLVREMLTASVSARMISDVPLGGLLSGGLDSSITVAIMTRLAGEAGGVRTFTAGFDDPTFDESADAQKVASFLGTEHTNLHINIDPSSAVDDIVAMFDEPFADSSALPTRLICRQARQHVTVALTGDGGDEVFGGYDRYRALQLAATMSPLAFAATKLAAGVIGPFASTEERHWSRRLVRFSESLTQPPSIQYLMHRQLFGPQDLSRLFTPEFASTIDIEAPARWFYNLYESTKLAEEVAIAQHHDLMTYLPDDLLVKTDISSMACSLELRAPMLDHNLVSLGLSLPVGIKIRRGQGKWILRKAFESYLPAEVFNRPKRGFGVPLGKWLRNELRPILLETLTDRSLLQMGIFNTESLAGLVNDHLSGRDDHRHRLWALLILARWLTKGK